MAKNGSLWTVLTLINRVTALQRSLRFEVMRQDAVCEFLVPAGRRYDPSVCHHKARLSCGNPGRHALSKTSGSSLEESRGPSMYRQPQLNGPIQVVGHATQQSLFDLLPIA